MSESLLKLAALWVIGLVTLALCLMIVFSPGAAARGHEPREPLLANPAEAQTLMPPVTLTEIEAYTEKALPVDTEEPNVPCDQILTRLEKYNTMARQHDTSVSTFLNEVSSKMLGWFDLLSPLEGVPQAVPVGVFAPLQDGANKIDAVTSLAYENSALLANEMDRLITSLKQCTLTAKASQP